MSTRDSWATDPSWPCAKQSRAMSLVEATMNLIVGFVLALLTQFAVFPLFGLVVSMANNFAITAIFTAVSLLRSFTLRRLFEALRASRARLVASDRIST